MRTLSQDKALSLALQEEQQLEGELQEALTAWATQVLVSHFMELAQMDYEKTVSRKLWRRLRNICL